MTYIDIANLKGPMGERGPRGLPGLEGVPTDEAVAEYAETDGTNLKGVLDGAYVQRGTLAQNLRDFGAVGDGTTDDTAAWEAFQAAPGVKIIPPGTYMIDGEEKTFTHGVIGNGRFDDASSAWDQPRGDHERQTIILHRNEIDANAEPVSPVIKTQTHVNFEVDDPEPASFKHVGGSYHEMTLDGYYDIDTDTNQNFTTFGSTSKNRMAGLFGSLAGLFYIEDADETENPRVATMGATKNGCLFLRFTRRAKHEHGGYMFGQEIYAMNVADETLAVPYENNDFFSFGGTWTSGIKIGAFSSGAPISAALFTHGSSNSQHGFWNGLVVGGSGFKIAGQGEGASGTVGINLASWRAGAGYGDIGIKFRRANRHLHFVEGARIRSSLSRFIHEAGPAGISIEAGGGVDNYPYLHFRQNVTGAADGGSSLSTNGRIDSNPTYTRVTSVNGEVQLAAGASGIYSATSERFAPAIAADGSKHLGGANRRWNTIYATNGTISTSDERAKTDIESIPDEALDAWGDVEYARYRFKDAVQDKGTGRLHTGLIAQRVMEAFEAHGLDAADYGLLCYDEWDATEEDVREYTVTTREAVYEQVEVTPAQFRDVENEDGTTERVEVMPAEYEDGELLEPAVTETFRTVTPATEAGSLYGIRYEEALSFEAAFQRRRGDRVEERLSQLEQIVGALTAAD